MPPSGDNNKGSASGGRDTNANKTPSSSGYSGAQSNYAMIKEGWGDRRNFQLSYGLGMTPEDIEEGNVILEAFRETDGGKTESQRK